MNCIDENGNINYNACQMIRMVGELIGSVESQREVIVTLTKIIKGLKPEYILDPTGDLSKAYEIAETFEKIYDDEADEYEWAAEQEPTDEKIEFAQRVADTDEFCDLPLSTQALLFHLVLKTDETDYVSDPEAIKRGVRATDGDMQILVEKGYVLMCADKPGVVVNMDFGR